MSPTTRTTAAASAAAGVALACALGAFTPPLAAQSATPRVVRTAAPTGAAGPAPSTPGPNPAAGITSERIARAPVAERDNWLTYYGGYHGQRYSLLDKINAGNVATLREAWTKTWPIPHKFESTPLHAWRFYTVPGPGEPGHDTWGGSPAWQTGGGPTWVTGTYDPELDLVYWGTGNAAPDMNGEVRPGDNLYTASVVALDPDDGTRRWHFQYTPHDVWDYDANSVQMLADLAVGGRPVKALLHADRNGFFYALDRATGQFLYATPFARQTWVKAIDPRTGRPVINPEGMPSAYYKPVCPSAHGATEWVHMAYSPATRMAYVPVMEQCAMFRTSQAFYEPALPFFGGDQDYDAFGPAEAHGSLTAIDAATGKPAWKRESKWPVDASVLATAGGVVFWREAHGALHATDARTGKDLWTRDVGAGIRGSSMTYAVDGRQYVAVTAGTDGEPHMHKLVVFQLP